MGELLHKNSSDKNISWLRKQCYNVSKLLVFLKTNRYPFQWRNEFLNLLIDVSKCGPKWVVCIQVLAYQSLCCGKTQSFSVSLSMLEQHLSCYNTTKNRQKIAYARFLRQSAATRSLLFQPGVRCSFLTWLLVALYIKPLLRKFPNRLDLFEGVAFARNAGEGVVRRRFLVVQFLFTIQALLGEKQFCLVSLVSFEKKSMLVAPSRKVTISGNWI